MRQMPGDGMDIKARIPKVPGSDTKNGTRQLVNISASNGAMSASIARMDVPSRDFRTKGEGLIRQCFVGISMHRTIFDLLPVQKTATVCDIQIEHSPLRPIRDRGPERIGARSVQRHARFPLD
jgi:hypothetical protein